MRHPREQLAVTLPYLSYLGLSSTCSSYIDYFPHCPLSKIYQEKRVVRYLLSSTHPFDILELKSNDRSGSHTSRQYGKYLRRSSLPMRSDFLR
jgi:hypothetical protein